MVKRLDFERSLSPGVFWLLHKISGSSNCNKFQFSKELALFESWRGKQRHRSSRFTAAKKNHTINALRSIGSKGRPMLVTLGFILSAGPMSMINT